MSKSTTDDVERYIGDTYSIYVKAKFSIINDVTTQWFQKIKDKYARKD